MTSLAHVAHKYLGRLMEQGSPEERLVSRDPFEGAGALRAGGHLCVARAGGGSHLGAA